MEQVLNQLMATISGMPLAMQLFVFGLFFVGLILFVLAVMRFTSPIGMGLGMGLQGLGKSVEHIGEGLGDGLGFVGEGVKNFGESFKIAAGLFAGIGQMFSNAGEGVKSALSGFGNMFTSFGKAAENATTHTVSAEIEIPGVVRMSITGQGVPATQMGGPIGRAVETIADKVTPQAQQISAPPQTQQLPAGGKKRRNIPLIGGGGNP